MVGGLNEELYTYMHGWVGGWVGGWGIYPWMVGEWRKGMREKTCSGTERWVGESQPFVWRRWERERARRSVWAWEGKEEEEEEEEEGFVLLLLSSSSPPAREEEAKEPPSLRPLSLLLLLLHLLLHLLLLPPLPSSSSLCIYASPADRITRLERLVPWSGWVGGWVGGRVGGWAGGWVGRRMYI